LNDIQRLEALEEILEALWQANQESPIIVEGQRDRLALSTLGMEGEIIVLNIGMSILDFCADVSRSHQSVIILTDWDRKGGQIGKKLREELEALDVKVETETRKKLSHLCGKVISTVEELDKYIASLRLSV